MCLLLSSWVALLRLRVVAEADVFLQLIELLFYRIEETHFEGTPRCRVPWIEAIGRQSSAEGPLRIKEWKAARDEFFR